jgi:hypothetical protein
MTARFSSTTPEQPFYFVLQQVWAVCITVGEKDQWQPIVQGWSFTKVQLLEKLTIWRLTATLLVVPHR